MQRWAVICKACHGPAFVVLGDLPAPTAVVSADRCQHLDGRPLTEHSLGGCDTCGADFTQSGVEPSDQWTLLPDTFVQAHNPQDGPWGAQADPRDIASVRLAIQSHLKAKAARRPRKRVVAHGGEERAAP